MKQKKIDFYFLFIIVVINYIITIKMPFNADTRAGILDIKFNVSVIHEELEAIYEKTYTGDTDEGSLFWEYVCDLESSFTNSCNFQNRVIDFGEWFIDNHNNIYSWTTIELDFIEE